MQGILIFIGPNVGQQRRATRDFWDACHWASEAVLCMTVGLITVLFEARTLLPSVREHLRKVAPNQVANAVGLALFHAWLGCYSVGGVIQTGGSSWQLLGKINGVTAWVVAGAHFVLCPFIDREDEGRRPDSAAEESHGEAHATEVEVPEGDAVDEELGGEAAATITAPTAAPVLLGARVANAQDERKAPQEVDVAPS